MITLTRSNFMKLVSYADNYWDIVQSGILVYNNFKYYYIKSKDTEELVYDIYALPEHILKHELSRHEMFCKYVGNHFNYKNGKRVTYEQHQRESHHKYYEAYSNYRLVLLNEWLKHKIKVIIK